MKTTLEDIEHCYCDYIFESKGITFRTSGILRKHFDNYTNSVWYSCNQLLTFNPENVKEINNNGIYCITLK